MKTTEYRIIKAQHDLHNYINNLAEHAIKDIHAHTEYAKMQVIKKAEHTNRSAGQRRRYAK